MPVCALPAPMTAARNRWPTACPATLLTAGMMTAFGRCVRVVMVHWQAREPAGPIEVGQLGGVLPCWPSKALSFAHVLSLCHFVCCRATCTECLMTTSLCSSQVGHATVAMALCCPAALHQGIQSGQEAGTAWMYTTLQTLASFLNG